MKCLKDAPDTIAAFLEPAEELRDKLGPILVQLKPNWGRNTERLRKFLEAATKTRRWTVEFRDPSWLCNEVYDVLREYNAALCLHDMIPDHPEIITTNWTYLRFHGDHYTGSYSHQFLTALAQRINGYRERGLDVYAYFNNDSEANAVFNALDLKRYVGEG